MASGVLSREQSALQETRVPVGKSLKPELEKIVNSSNRYSRILIYIQGHRP